MRFVFVFASLAFLGAIPAHGTDFPCSEAFTDGFNSAGVLFERYPSYFQQFTPSLIIAKGRVDDHEFESAQILSRILPSGASLALTPSMFGFKNVPSVDGIIYWPSGKITNMTLKSKDISKTTSTNLAGEIKDVKNRAQKSVRTKFNLATFAAQFHSEVDSNGKILVPPGKKGNRKVKEDKLNLIAKIFGLSLKQPRKTTVVVTINNTGGKIIEFVIENIGGDDHIGITGWSGISRINVSSLIRNLQNDPHIDGYIFTSSTQSLIIDREGYDLSPIPAPN